MKGHEQVIALRRRGVRPACLWVSDYDCLTVGDGLTVSVEQQDTPERIDWRFVVGLTVLLDGFDGDRLMRIAKACGPFAKRIVTTIFCPATWRVQSINDTEGVLTWPSC